MAYGNKGEDLSLMPRTKLLKIDVAMCTYNPGIGEVETDGLLHGASWPTRLSKSMSPSSARDPVLKHRGYSD